MAWVTDDGTHEGYVGTEVPDGRLAAAYSASGVEAWNETTKAFDAFQNDAVTGWVMACECGWRGRRWERVTNPDSADWEAAAARRRLDGAVASARAAGASWTDIGRATGLTRQSAHERWSRPE